MTPINHALSTLSNIDGFVAAALVDSDSGMVLGTEQRSTLDLERAGASSTEVIRAKRRTIGALKMRDEIQDIVVTLGKQYHLSRPLRDRPAVFFYLVLDRAHANLAMARIRLADAETALSL